MSLSLIFLLLSPLFGFLINAFRFSSENRIFSGLLASFCSLSSFVSSIFLFYFYTQNGQTVISFLNWLSVGSLNVNFSFLIDSLSVLMACMITGVSTLIHFFSISYMDHDKRPSKYFSYLNLFLFNMLILILADNLVLMFVGWEGVGLLSYLLIGFWFEDMNKAKAGTKAFITNRIGDFGFLIGIFLSFYLFGSFDYLNILGNLPSHSTLLISLMCLALFFGATGKSAQIPLYVWLPDAMAGPTPVSALIHAATMVTAGIYMIARLSPLFLLAPYVMNLIAVIGALTALLAALIALTQWDIKKVLAYSTVSQLGYMFLALGVGAFSSAIFHLLTHAFFKALMFLAAGSIIYSLGHVQDIRKMGLGKKLPSVYYSFLFAYLAIIGIFPFSGFFSKDEILWNSIQSPHGGFFLWFLAFLTAGLTAFYMTRLMSYVFWRKQKVNFNPVSPLMKIPLIILAVFSLFSGLLGFPHIFHSLIPLDHFLEKFLNPSLSFLSLETDYLKEAVLMFLSLLLAVLCALISYFKYVKSHKRVLNLLNKLQPVYFLSENKFYVDEFYKSYLLNPVKSFCFVLWEFIDVKLIDQMTYQLSFLSMSCSRFFKQFQKGDFQLYSFYFFCGISFIVLFSILRGFL